MLPTFTCRLLSLLNKQYCVYKAWLLILNPVSAITLQKKYIKKKKKSNKLPSFVIQPTGVQKHLLTISRQETSVVQYF